MRQVTSIIRNIRVHLPCRRTLSSSSGFPIAAISDMAHNAVGVDIARVKLDSFEAHLSRSLSEWRTEGKTAVWLRVPEDRAQTIPVAAAHGFAYHHAEPGA